MKSLDLYFSTLLSAVYGLMLLDVAPAVLMWLGFILSMATAALTIIMHHRGE